MQQPYAAIFYVPRVSVLDSEDDIIVKFYKFQSSVLWKIVGKMEEIYARHV